MVPLCIVNFIHPEEGVLGVSVSPPPGGIDRLPPQLQLTGRWRGLRGRDGDNEHVASFLIEVVAVGPYRDGELNGLDAALKFCFCLFGGVNVLPEQFL